MKKGVAVVDADLIRSQVSEGARAMVKLVYPELEVEDPIFLAHRQRFLDTYGADIAGRYRPIYWHVSADLKNLKTKNFHGALSPINHVGSVKHY